MTNSDSNGGTSANKKPKNSFPRTTPGQGPGVRGVVGRISNPSYHPVSARFPAQPRPVPRQIVSPHNPSTLPSRWGCGKRQSDSPNYQISKSPTPSFPRTTPDSGRLLAPDPSTPLPRTPQPPTPNAPRADTPMKPIDTPQPRDRADVSFALGPCADAVRQPAQSGVLLPVSGRRGGPGPAAIPGGRAPTHGAGAGGAGRRQIGALERARRRVAAAWPAGRAGQPLRTDAPGIPLATGRPMGPAPSTTTRRSGRYGGRFRIIWSRIVAKRSTRSCFWTTPTRPRRTCWTPCRGWPCWSRRATPG